MTPNDPPPTSVQSVSSVDGAVVGRKRSRLAQDVPDETVAAYGAARAFLLGEWFGAAVMVASFTLLYLFAFGSSASTAVTYIVCLALLAVGTFAFVRCRAYYQSIEFPWAHRWHIGALLVAGSAVIFWLLFVFLVVLAWLGVQVLPADRP